MKQKLCFERSTSTSIWFCLPICLFGGKGVIFMVLLVLQVFHKKKGEAIYPSSVKWGLLTWIRWIMHTIFLFIPLNPSEVPPPLQLPNLIQPPLFGGSPFMLLFYHWLFSTSLCSLSRFPDSFVRGIS